MEVGGVDREISGAAVFLFVCVAVDTTLVLKMD